MKKTTKPCALSSEDFGDLLRGVKEALYHAQKKKITVRVRTVPLRIERPALSAQRIRALRRRFNMSQAVFGELLCVKGDTVGKWELGVRGPSGPVLLLLQIAEKHPEVFMER